MKKNSPTEAGPTKKGPSDELVDAINQVFTIFRSNYHNQYFKAFSNESERNLAKRLWLDALKQFSPETILKATKSVITSSEFLPTLRTMIVHCNKSSELNLPDAHSAYMEACRAPSPKNNFSWSHLAIYYAGKKTDWHFLQSNTESVVFPIFKQHYEAICSSLYSGETLDAPKPTENKLEKSDVPALDRNENREKLSALIKALEL